MVAMALQRKAVSGSFENAAVSHAIKMNEHERLAFTLAEYERRYHLVMQGMERAGIEVLLVRTPENICYLTGYETPGYYGYYCLVLAHDRGPVLVLRRFEQMNVWESSWLEDSEPVEDDEVPHAVTIRVLKERGLEGKRIGLEEQSFFTPVMEYKAMAEALGGPTLVDGSGIVEAARVIKSEEEVALMRRCAAIVDRAMEHGLEAVRIGATEDDVSAEIHHALYSAGAEYPSLTNFICAGPRTSVPHATWRGQRIEQGDPVYIELSAVKHRYNTALLVCACIGEPSAKLRALADASLAGLQAAKDTIRPGVPCEDVYWALHNAIVERGFGEYHPHRAGYSIGISFPPDWGEGEILSLRKGEPRRLEPNMIFHIIPDILVYREIGVCFSDTVRVTDSGCEAFSRIPRELVVR